MKKSNRALLGLVLLDAVILAGAGWMIAQVRTGAWRSLDPAGSITQITTTAGVAIGVITGILLVAFVVHRRRGR